MATFNYKNHKVTTYKVKFNTEGYNPNETQYMSYKIEGLNENAKIQWDDDSLETMKTHKEAKEFLKRFIDNAVYHKSYGWCIPHNQETK